MAMTPQEIQNRIGKHFPGQAGIELYKVLSQLVADITAAGDVSALEATVTAQGTSITNLNAWGTALATKLNADAGVTDTNYDTNPQA